ncbi:MAG: type II secretion system protein, partial [Acidobacteriota bacterium]
MLLRSVVINTVIGKRTISSCKENSARGFTLLELLIAMFIIIVL